MSVLESVQERSILWRVQGLKKESKSKCTIIKVYTKMHTWTFLNIYKYYNKAFMYTCIDSHIFTFL